jgi:hypothetical protein
MGSIIGVETLQNPNGTTAATIDASGNIKMAGHVVQYVEARRTTMISAGSSVFSNGSTHVEVPECRITFTPKFADSKLRITIGTDMNMTSGNAGSWVGVRRDDVALYTGSGNGSNLTNTEGSTGADTFGFVYRSDAGSNNHHFPLERSILYDANSTNAQVFKLMVSRFSNTGASSFGHWAPTIMSIMEIAQ